MIDIFSRESSVFGLCHFYKKKMCKAIFGKTLVSFYHSVTFFRWKYRKSFHWLTIRKWQYMIKFIYNFSSLSI